MIDMKRFGLMMLVFTLAGGVLLADDEIYPVAVLPFSERGKEVAEQGQQVTDLMFANLVLGFISRIAPQMNIYSIGFPVTVVLGMLALTGIVPALEEPMAAVTSTMLSKFLYR